MGSSNSVEKIEPLSKFYLFIENKRNETITVMQISNTSRYKIIVKIERYDNAIFEINPKANTFIYVYLGKEIKGNPITKIKNCHLFSKNTTVYIN